MHSIHYQAWKEKQQAIGPHMWTGYDGFMDEHPEVKEYECYDLDPACKLAHIETEPLFVTNHLHEACGFVYDRFLELGIECCVWQERSKGYREYYKHPKFKRDSKGRFAK